MASNVRNTVDCTSDSGPYYYKRHTNAQKKYGCYATDHEIINISNGEDPLDDSIPFNHSVDLSSASMPKNRSNIKQIIISAIFLIIAVMFNLTVLAVIHERVPRDQPPLPDISFDFLPKNDRALDFSEYIIMFMTTSVCVLTIFHRYRSILFRRICLMLGVLYMFRGICMAVTQVPVANPQYYCSPKLNVTATRDWWNITKTIVSRVSHMSLGMGLSVNGRHSFCGDYIFSGHTVMLVISYSLLYEYLFSSKQRWTWNLIRYIYKALVFVGLACILVARGHYMIDVVLAYFITTRTFYIYHTMCSDAIQKNKTKKNHLKSIWWYPLFHFVESDIIEQRIDVTNEFEIPKLTCLKDKTSSFR